jgi:hypothetical protein
VCCGQIAVAEERVEERVAVGEERVVEGRCLLPVISATWPTRFDTRRLSRQVAVFLEAVA